MSGCRPRAGLGCWCVVQLIYVRTKADMSADDLPSGVPSAVGQPLVICGTSGGVAKVWDYQSVACVASLEGHGSPLTSVKVHPELPIILTGCDITLEHVTECPLNSRGRG